MLVPSLMVLTRPTREICDGSRNELLNSEYTHRLPPLRNELLNSQLTHRLPPLANYGLPQAWWCSQGQHGMGDGSEMNC